MATTQTIGTPVNVANIYQEAQAKKAKKAEQQKTVERVQNAFLHQVEAGKSEKEAFVEALKAIDEKYNPECDKFCCSEKLGASNQMIKASGKVVRDVADDVVEVAKKSIDPDDFKKWLEVISFAVPIFEGFVDWILDKMTPSKEISLQENCVARTP